MFFTQIINSQNSDSEGKQYRLNYSGDINSKHNIVTQRTGK